ncbi:ACP S-malonyltransferase [Kitasatospora sp. NPDC054939]
MRPHIPPFHAGLPADERRPQTPDRRATAVLLDPQSRINPGEHRALYEALPEARGRLAEASELVGLDLAGALLDGTDEEVNQGVVARPAVVALSVALYHEALRGRPRPDFLAGLSLGQITAAHLAGCMSFQDAVRMCHTMATVEEEAYGGRPYGVSFFHNADPVKLTDLMQRLDAPDAPLRPCAYVADDQMIVSGELGALRGLAEQALGLGALGLLIPYGPPAHCELLAEVQEEFAARWRYRDGLADPEIPLICNLTAQPLTTAAGIGVALVEQYTRPVQWAGSLYELGRQGVGEVVVPGPGRFLHRSLESLTVRFDTLGPDEVLGRSLAAAGAAS